MRTRIEPLLVVEGATDVAFLQSFLDADFVITNGSEVSRETIDYLKAVKKSREIVVLTDPDFPGQRIRNILDQEIPGLLHAFIPKEKAIKKHKVGVAESDPQTILEALKFALEAPHREKGNLTMQDLYELSLNGCLEASQNRKKLSESLHLGHNNAKSLLKRLNILGITKAEIPEVLKNG